MEKAQIIEQMITDSITKLEKNLELKTKVLDKSPSSDSLRDLFEIATALECLQDDHAKSSIREYLNNLSESDFHEISELSKSSTNHSFGFLLKDALLYSQDSEETYRDIVENSLDMITW